MPKSSRNSNRAATGRAHSNQTERIHFTGLSREKALLLDNQLCFALYSSSLAMSKTYQPLLGELGLTYPQYLVMLVLWQRDEQAVSDIGERLFLDSGTLTPLLKRLELANLIERNRSPNDERVVIVSLTKKGLELKRAAAKIPRRVLCAVDASIDEVGKMTRELQKLRTKLLKSNLTD